MRQRVIDEAALRALRGIGPESIPDWLALVGDTADGFPGLDGFGEKGAAMLLARFGKLERVPRDPRLWPEGMRGRDLLAQTLFAHFDEALLYRTLATLRTDAPIDDSLAALEYRGVPREPFETFCAQAGANGLRARVSRWAG
jgi:5'-3' exonuclease